MNPDLDSLHPYPFEKLRTLLADVKPSSLRPIRLSIGEPQHATPELVRRAFIDHLDGLAVYPLTVGSDRLRDAIRSWFVRRYRLARLDAGTEVLPVNGTREALFAFAQAVVDRTRPGAAVLSPNPFYQIYEGAAILAGATPIFLNQIRAARFGLDLDRVPAEAWRRVQLAYVCTPGNPTGRVLTLDEWRALFDLADRHDFTIASDECYSEIYPDESRPPLGGLEAASALGRADFRRLVVFSSLSKRSNAPGLRSGAVAGDAALLRPFLLYRTYHGCAMSPAVQEASVAAWNDEAHVRENRRKYREKFATLVPLLEPVLEVEEPDAGFYLWARVPGGDDEAFARALFQSTHVTVLPGSYLGREHDGVNPGRGYVRIALVPEIADCIEAAERIRDFCRHGSHEGSHAHTHA